MSNPRVVAAISAVGVLLLGYRIFFSTGESPSPAVAILQWVFFIAAMIGLVGSLIQIARGSN
jgi:hypothetical protein